MTEKLELSMSFEKSPVETLEEWIDLVKRQKEGTEEKGPINRIYLDKNRPGTVNIEWNTGEDEFREGMPGHKVWSAWQDWDRLGKDNPEEYPKIESVSSDTINEEEKIYDISFDIPMLPEEKEEYTEKFLKLVENYKIEA